MTGEQYDRARQLLLSLWPHTWPQPDDRAIELIAEIMVGFARMEVRRAQNKQIEWNEWQ